MRTFDGLKNLSDLGFCIPNILIFNNLEMLFIGKHSILITSKKSLLSNNDKISSLELFTVVAFVVEANKSLTIAAIRLLSLDVDADRANIGVCCLFIGINDISLGC